MKKVYLMLGYELPKIVTQDVFNKVFALKEAIKETPWIDEVFDVTNDLEKDCKKMWILKFDDYECLNRLNEPDYEVSRAYSEWFNSMQHVTNMVKEGVHIS